MAIINEALVKHLRSPFRRCGTKQKEKGKKDEVYMTIRVADSRNIGMGGRRE